MFLGKFAGVWGSRTSFDHYFLPSHSHFALFIAAQSPDECLQNGYRCYNGVGYLLYYTEKNFADAQQQCQLDGGTLAMPKTAEMNVRFEIEKWFWYTYIYWTFRGGDCGRVVMMVVIDGLCRGDDGGDGGGGGGGDGGGDGSGY